jgi:hypothetical protein
METRVSRLIQGIVRENKGMVVLIGDTYTGKTYTICKILKKLNIRTIPYDFDEIPKGAGQQFIKQFNTKKGNKIQDFYSTKHTKTMCSSTKPQEVLFCDALETYSTSVLTFLKNLCETTPIIATCDKSITVPNTKLIERVWWNGSRKTPTDWEGDTLLSTPRDLFVSLTKRRVSKNKAVRNFGADPFLLTQYYHDEFPNYKNIDLHTFVQSTSALSLLDTFRLKEWNSNGLTSTKNTSEELFVRTIRTIHKSPCLKPKGWFPRTLSTQAKITRHQLELAGITNVIPNVHDRISVFNFNIGKSCLYKTLSPKIIPICNSNTIELYSRAIELLGHKSLTKTEIKKILKGLLI